MLLLAGCAGRGVDQPAGARDSAGVAIVDNQTLAPADSARYQLDSVPILDIGGETDDALLLTRPTRPHRLSDGRIVVVDYQPTGIRVFSPTGIRLKDIGRDGDGPGEYRAPFILGGLPGDSLVVFEAVRRQLIIYDSAGKLGRIVPWTAPSIAKVIAHQKTIYRRHGASIAGEPSAEILALLPGHRLLVAVRYARSDPPEPGLYRHRDTMVVVVQRLGDSSGTGAEVGQFAATELESEITMSSVSQNAAPLFGRETFVTVRDSSIVVADNDRFELRVYRPNGTLTQSIRRHIDRAITDAEFRLAMENRTGETRRPDAKPAFDDLVSSTTGELWVREFDSPGNQSTTQRYDVFDPSGRWKTVVALPRAFKPSWIGADTILGLWTDDEGVVHIRAYRFKDRGK